MKTLCLLSAATLLPGLMAAQRNQEPLSYQGWTLGISLDSATKLTASQIASPLVCVGMDTRTLFCQTEPGTRYASLYFSPVPRRLEEVSLIMPFDRRASRDSVEKWFTSRWGTPIAREVIDTKLKSKRRTKPETDAIGSWVRDEMVFGTVGIGSYDTTRMLAISISSPARQIRLLRERADTSHK
jgi:hypothetical protein